MKNALIIVLTLFSTAFIYAQKGEWSFHTGFKVSYKWGAKPPYVYRDIDAGISIDKIAPLVTNSFALVYSRQVSQKLYLSLGLHRDVKGYRETGKIYDVSRFIGTVEPYK